MNISLAKMVTYVSLISWIFFVLLELLMPTSVTRLFSPHWFLLAFLIGAIGWYNLLVRK